MNKKVLFGSIFAALLMLLMPMVSSVQGQHLVEESNLLVKTKPDGNSLIVKILFALQLICHVLFFLGLKIAFRDGPWGQP